MLKFAKPAIIAIFLIAFAAGCGGGTSTDRATLIGVNVEKNDLDYAIQKAGASWVVAENEISQLPSAQRRVMNGASLTRDGGRFMVPAPARMAETLPSSMDWRDYNGLDWMTPVKTQRGCGSCVAFASVGVMEALNNIVNTNATLDLDLSESDIFSCNGGKCSSGWKLSSAADALVSKGVADEACLPYAASDSVCSSKCSNYSTRTKKLTSWSWLPANRDAIKTGLAAGPVLSAMKVYTDFYYYKSGVYKHVSGALEGGHAIVIIGYNEAGQYWIVRNSWGTSWGENGYARIAYGEVSLEDFAIALNMASIVPTVTASVPTNDLVLSGGQAAVSLTCIVSGTITSVEARCSSSADWTSGASKSCVYIAAGNYTPECRVNGTLIDAVDSPVVVRELIPVCGNSVVEGSEQCDDGNTAIETCAYGQTSCSVCNAACESVAGAVSYCGDGSISAANNETCDDGNTTAGDGCNSSCRIETVCGDGNRQGDEQCDDGNTVTEACSYGQRSCTVCNATCGNAAGAVAYCGDQTVQTANSESCDDGNTTAGDGCSASCLIETVCGDGKKEGAEQCDDENAVTEYCAYGAESCTVCNSLCQNGPGRTTRCGDNTIDRLNNENCDDGNTVTEACPYGSISCIVCGATCRSIVGPVSYCGDGVTDTVNSEVCDDGNNTNEVCSYGQQSCAICNLNCLTVAGATTYCGDRVVDTNNNENCDDGNATAESCAYGSRGCSVCGVECRAVDGATSYCGDGKVDAASEQCDEGNLELVKCAYGLLECNVCNPSCVTVVGEPTYCGDGTLDVANLESCDDGNTTAGDGCSASCMLE